MSYSKILSAAWQQHLKTRTCDAPTVISLFAGCGGSSLGYSMAGFRELMAVEWDDHAVECFKRNFPGVPVYHGDISKLDVANVLQQHNLQVGDLDVLDGSPPCQGFSVAGKRKFGDDRNQLFREFVRLLKGLQPKIFVMENVSGMIKGSMKLIFRDVLQELKSAGYQVKCCLLTASWYGVPQNRQRVIFIGIRNDINKQPSHPLPTVERVVTVREALIDLPIQSSESSRAAWFWQAAARVIPLNGKTMMAARLAVKRKDGAFSTVLLDWDRPSPTIPKTVLNTCGMIHPSRTRLLSRHELKRLTSFPDEFVIEGTYEQVHARIGNSVPPLFMKAIAEHVKTLLF